MFDCQGRMEIDRNMHAKYKLGLGLLFSLYFMSVQIIISEHLDLPFVCWGHSLSLENNFFQVFQLANRYLLNFIFIFSGFPDCQ